MLPDNKYDFAPYLSNSSGLIATSLDDLDLEEPLSADLSRASVTLKPLM